MYATVFNIFKFELNPLNNKKDISLYVLFRTFSVSENFLAESVFFLQNKICPFLAQSICIYISHSFFMKHCSTNSLHLSFSLE